MMASVVDRLTGALAVSFRTMSRGAADARADRPRPARFGDLIEALPQESLIAVLAIGGWSGHCLAVLDRGMAEISIGLLLAEPLDQSRPRGRGAFTAIERVVVERLARDQIATHLARALNPVAELDVALDYMTGDAADAAIALPPAACLTWTITVTVEGRTGLINFLLPYAAVEPIRPQLSRDPSGSGQDNDVSWRQHLRTELPLAGVPLRAVIEHRRISAAQVLRWRPGSVLPLNRHHEEPIDVFRGDLLVLRARIAEHNGRVALHVEERRLAEDWPAPS
jgi:flagellar motor switch protein FliM